MDSNKELNYWIFKTTPDQFKIDKRLAMTEERQTCWAIPAHHGPFRQLIKLGDVGFIWKISPRNNYDECGIVARMVVTGEPSLRVDLPCELLCYEPEEKEAKGRKETSRILADYTSAFSLISRAKLEETPEICYSELFNGTDDRATVIKLERRKGQLLEQRIKEIGWPLKGWPKP